MQKLYILILLALFTFPRANAGRFNRYGMPVLGAVSGVCVFWSIYQLSENRRYEKTSDKYDALMNKASKSQKLEEKQWRDKQIFEVYPEVSECLVGKTAVDMLKKTFFSDIKDCRCILEHQMAEFDKIKVQSK